MSPLQQRHICQWCGAPLEGQRRDAVYCRRRCRQAAFRTRQAAVLRESDAQPKRIAYADPPYPGRAWMYKDQPSYAGEVDHAALIASLRSSYDGWALSTAEDALQELLPLCPKGVRIAAWHKPRAAQRTTRGIEKVWEPVIVWPARQLQPGIPSALRALPARGGGTLIGRKPLKFCAWLFGLLGALPGDDFADLFPGTGVVGQAWRAFVSPVDERNVFAGAERQLSPEDCGDVSRAAAGYAFADVAGDAFGAAPGDTSADGTDDTSPRGLADTSARAMNDTSAAGVSDTCRCSRGDTSAEDLDDACGEYSGDGCVEHPGLARSASPEGTKQG